MYKPPRIMIFGIVCLVVSVLSGVKNTIETGASLLGPEGLEQVLSIAKQGQGFPEYSEQSLRVEIQAQQNSAYRIGQAIESTVSMLMAALLLIGGLGLLACRSWSLKLIRWWALYAIPATGLAIALSARYAMPLLPEANSASIAASAALMLLVFWAFPVLVLTVLPTKAVKHYLAYRDSQMLGQAHRPQQPTQAETVLSNTVEPKHSKNEIATTWRDDPWRDNGV